MRLTESRLSYDGLIHDSASIFLGKSCMVDSDKGESQNKHTKEGRIKKKKC